MIFDDVEVPRDRVFIDGNLPVYNSVMSASWRAQRDASDDDPGVDQAGVRLGHRQPHGRSDQRHRSRTHADAGRDLELCRIGPQPRSFAGEQGAHEYGNGVLVPGRAADAARCAPCCRYWFPRVNEIIRLIGSHNVLATPTAAQFADPELRPLIDKYLRGAGDVTAEERARVFRLGWDFAGSALAQPERAV